VGTAERFFQLAVPKALVNNVLKSFFNHHFIAAISSSGHYGFEDLSKDTNSWNYPEKSFSNDSKNLFIPTDLIFDCYLEFRSVGVTLKSKASKGIQRIISIELALDLGVRKVLQQRKTQRECC
jgi:hypothetical protein